MSFSSFTSALWRTYNQKGGLKGGIKTCLGVKFQSEFLWREENVLFRCWLSLGIYPQKAEAFVHIHINTAGSVAAQSTAIGIVVVIIGVYAILPGTEPFVVRSVGVATAIKCHFHLNRRLS
jgi:hypothetical protein